LSVIHRHAHADNAVQFGAGNKALLSASGNSTVRLDNCEYCALLIERLQGKAH